MTIDTKLHYIIDSIQSALDKIDATEPQSEPMESTLAEAYQKLEGARDLLREQEGKQEAML